MSELAEIRKVIWNNDRLEDGADRLLEQYKLYVEMADRISQRRGAANTFFLTFNTAIVGAIAGFFDKVPPRASEAFFFAAVVLAGVWIVMLRQYRNINRAKFDVIRVMEEKLPANMYGQAEWDQALGGGKNLNKFISLSTIERAVPFVFVAIYAYLFFTLSAKAS